MCPSLWQELTAGKPLSETKTKELVKILEDAGVVFGPASRSELVSHAARGCAQDEVVKFMKIVCPYSDALEKFNPMQPCLADAGLGSVETVSRLVKLLLHERLIPAIKRGSHGAETLCAYATFMTKMASERPEHLDELLVHTLQEIADIGRFFTSIADPGCQEEADAGVREAREGAKGLVRLALGQSPYWQQRDAESQQVAQANKCLGPQLRDVLQQLEKQVEGADKAVISKLPVFLDALLPASSANLLNKLMVYERAAVEKIKTVLDEGKVGGDAPGCLRNIAQNCDQVSCLATEASWKQQYSELSRETKQLHELAEKALQRSQCQEILQSFLAEDMSTLGLAWLCVCVSLRVIVCRCLRVCACCVGNCQSVVARPQP